jgi:hypothetical protein
MRVVAILLLAGVAVWVYAHRDTGTGTSLRRYCEYGSVSEAQFAGCLNHVTEDQINARNTDAARFAKGKLDACLATAGPICDEDSP